MKNIRNLGMMGVLCAVAVYLFTPPQQVAAQPGGTSGTPPIGRIVEVTLVAWPSEVGAPLKVMGNLLSMTGDWIVVKEGSYEHWMPKEKVMDMKASR
jgi:hypothetical protein